MSIVTSLMKIENTFLPLCHVLRHTFNMYQGGILHPKEIC
jgi:hypothetical protein